MREKLRSLSCLLYTYRHRPVQLQSSTLDWTSQVTAIDLTGQHIQRLSCLDQLPNLKWLCLQDNALTTADVSSIFY